MINDSKDKRAPLADYRAGMGLTLLGIALLNFGIIAYAYMLVSFGLGCGFGHSFLKCTIVPSLFVIYFFLNILVALLAIVQMIKPFFGRKTFVSILILFLTIFVLAFVMERVTSSLAYTEQECLLVGYYDKETSNYCYYKLAQESNNASYCDKAGSDSDICVTKIESRAALERWDYSLCPTGDAHEVCVENVALKKLDIQGCYLLKSDNRKSFCIEYVEERVR